MQLTPEEEAFLDTWLPADLQWAKPDATAVANVAEGDDPDTDDDPDDEAGYPADQDEEEANGEGQAACDLPKDGDA